MLASRENPAIPGKGSYLSPMKTVDLSPNPPISDLTKTLTRFPKLDRRAFQHPLDLAAVRAMENTPAFPQIIKWFNGKVIDVQSHMHALGGEVRVGTKQYPSLNRAFLDLVEVLDLPKLPELFIQNGPLNAYASGSERPKITVTAAIMDLMNDEEALFIIGHELGHAKAEHVLYNQVYHWLSRGAFTFFDIPFAGAVIHAVTLAMFLWSRKAEFTADRAGLLACQNPDAALSALAKLASGGYRSRSGETLNLAALQAQAKDFRETTEESLLNRILEASMSQGDTHPACVHRLEMLKAWVEDGSYQKILDGNYTKQGAISEFAGTESRIAVLCSCGAMNEQGSTYCGKCRQRIANPTLVCGSCGGPVGGPTCQRCGQDFNNETPHGS